MVGLHTRKVSFQIYLLYIQIKDILWTATGGTIPASGNGARYVVLTDDSESSAAALGDRQIIAVWDMVTDRVATNGFPISLTNLELRTVGLGGAVSTDSITEGEDAAPDDYEGQGPDGYGDANNDVLPDDPNVMAYYRFEPDAMLVDSSGNGNTLNVYDGAPAIDTSNYIEGAGGLYLRRVSDADCLNIPWANISDNFPTKSGAGSGTTFSLCYWVKFNTLPDAHDSPNFHTSGCFGFQGSFDTGLRNLTNWGGNIAFYFRKWTDDYYDHASPVQTGRWYHVAFTYDSADDSYRIRVYDNTAGSILGVDKTGVLTTPIPQAGMVPLIGVAYSSDALDGYMDELIVFNKVLSVEEIDAIRNGTYVIV